MSTLKWIPIDKNFLPLNTGNLPYERRMLIRTSDNEVYLPSHYNIPHNSWYIGDNYSVSGDKVTHYITIESLLELPI